MLGLSKGLAPDPSTSLSELPLTFWDAEITKVAGLPCAMALTVVVVVVVGDSSSIAGAGARSGMSGTGTEGLAGTGLTIFSLSWGGP